MSWFRIANSRVCDIRMRAILAVAFALVTLLACSPSCFAQDAAAIENAAIKDAAQSIVAGNLKRAESDLESILRTNPREYRALNLLGMIRAQQNRDVDAEKIFKKVIQLRPGFGGAHVNLGLLYLQTSRLDDAIAQFQEALRLEPGRDDARGALVNTLRAQARSAADSGELEKALSFLIEARKASPNDANVLYDFGMVALRMSLFADSAQAFRETLAKRPDDAKSLYGLGRAEIGLAKYQDAADTFSRYVQLYPQDASGHYALGVALASLEKTPDASAEFRRSIEIQPEQTESYLQLGRICLDESDLDCAAADFDRVLSRDPRHAEALSGMGRVEFQRKNYAEAAELLQRSIAVDTSGRQTHYYLGLAYARLGRDEESKKEFQTASELERTEVERHRAPLKLMDSSQNTNEVKHVP